MARDSQPLPHVLAQGGGQPRGPWVRWVGCCLREAVLSKWKPGLGNCWLTACRAPGKPCCSAKVPQPQRKVVHKMERAGDQVLEQGWGSGWLQPHYPCLCAQAPFAVGSLYSQGPIVHKCCKRPTNSIIVFSLLPSAQLSVRFPTELRCGQGSGHRAGVGSPLPLHSSGPHPHPHRGGKAGPTPHGRNHTAPGDLRQWDPILTSRAQM